MIAQSEQLEMPTFVVVLQKEYPDIQFSYIEDPSL